MASAPNKVVLVATGALTNVALLLTLFPEVQAQLDKIVILGGAVREGNISPAAEFNILVCVEERFFRLAHSKHKIDPHAAEIVFQHGTTLPIFLITIDVSHTNIVTAARTEQIGAAIGFDSPFARVVHDLLSFFAATYRTVFGFHDGPPLHDPLAVLFVIAPVSRSSVSLKPKFSVHQTHTQL